MSGTLFSRVVLIFACSLPPCVAHATTFIIPHFIEHDDTAPGATYTFDTTLYFAYAAGQNGVAGGGGATIDLYLFDNTGNPIKSQSSADVCAPCSYNLGNGQRKVTARLEDLIVAAGGSFTGFKVGYALIVVSGDADGVRMSATLSCAKSNAYDLSMTPLPIQKIVSPP